MCVSCHTRDVFLTHPPFSLRPQVNQNETQLHYSPTRATSRSAYTPLELIFGCTLDNALLIPALKPQCADAAGKLGFALGDLFEEGCVVEEECDAGLGNGGLGLLAVCYHDSSVSRGIPAWGLEPHYNYGAPRLSRPSPSCARADARA